MFATPVLLIIFNRDDNVGKTLAVLRDIQASKIFIAADGPRNATEAKRVKQTRLKVLEQIDWHCEVRTQFQDQNLGCRDAVHSGIQWFFSQNEFGIVLEDDCLPTKNFFAYCEAFLHHFRDQKNVAAICGRMQLSKFQFEANYGFSRRFFCWGWASWRDRVVGIDIDTAWKEPTSSYLGPKTPIEERLYIKGTLGLLASNQVNSWAYIYDLHFRKRNQVSIVPSENMILNLGLGTDGTHTIGSGNDTAHVSDDFLPIPTGYQLSEPDNAFTRQCLLFEFGGWTKLVLFSLSRETRWARLLWRRIRRSLVS